jgi:hypothetical protein
MGATFGVLLLLTGMLYVPLWALERIGGFRGALDLNALSPVSAFVNSFDVYYRLGFGPQRYWISLLSMAGLALAQFAAACLLVRRNQLPSERKPSSLFRATIRRRVSGNAYEWLLLRDRCPSAGVWLIVLLLLAIWGGCLTGSLVSSSRVPTIPLFIMAMIAAFTLHVVLKGMLIAHASRRLAEDRQSGALEILLATPLSPHEIVRAHRRALWLQFRGLLGLILLVNFILTIATLAGRRRLHMGHDDAFVFCSFFIGGGLLLLVDFFLIPWVAMSEALRGKRQHRAVLGTVMRSLAPSWLALFGFIFVGMGINLDSEAVATFFWLWAILSSVGLLVVAMNRQFELRHRFRVVAAGDREWKSHRPPTIPPVLPQPTPPVLNAIRG